MSIVGDLREALQDVVAPDLKAVVRGLADLKEEVRSSNALLREEMRTVERRTAERIEASEQRTAERIERVYDKIEIAELKSRNQELTRENQQLKSPQLEQQH